MSKSSKLLLSALILLLSVSVAYASNMTITPINDQISPYDFATYGLYVYNTNQYTQRYMITVRDIRWSVQTDPLTDYTTGLVVGGQSSGTTILMLKPNSAVPFGPQNIEVTLTAANETLTQIVTADVRQDLIRYPFQIDANLSAPDVFDPRSVTSVKVVLGNKNNLIINNLTITLNSSLFEKSTSVDLGPSSQKVVEFSIALDPSTSYTQDTMNVGISYNGSLVKSLTESYEVMPYSEIFKKTITTTQSFLKTVTTINYLNDASSERKQVVAVNTSLLAMLFTSTDPAMDAANVNGTYYYTKTIDLAAGQSYNIVVTTNYGPILYAIVLIIVIVGLYFWMRSPVTIVKEARDIEVVEGGISRLKVVIKIKNRSSQTLKNLRLFDRIPHIAMFESKGAETLKPKKVYPYQEGTVLSYEIPRLEPGVVLIVNYEAKTKLGVVGDFRLKPAIVQFYDKKAYSNAVDVYVP